MTDSIVEQLVLEARQMASGKRIDFYRDFNTFHSISKRFFFSNSLVGRCKRDVLPYLEQDLDHGIQHAKKVAMDAGTLILVEGRGWDPARTRQWCLLAQLAGLLHDIHAPKSDHARTGADAARKITAFYPLTPEEREAIVFAVRHHENPLGETRSAPCLCRWINNAVHDADKFRWSLDSLPLFLRGKNPGREHRTAREACLEVPQSMQKIRSIASTFRTGTGQRYGPQFINAGLAIGEHLHRRLNEHVVN